MIILRFAASFHSSCAFDTNGALGPACSAAAMSCGLGGKLPRPVEIHGFTNIPGNLSCTHLGKAWKAHHFRERILLEKYGKMCVFSFINFHHLKHGDFNTIL
jgi:hypothetical protein